MVRGSIRLSTEPVNTVFVLPAIDTCGDGTSFVPETVVVDTTRVGVPETTFGARCEQTTGDPPVLRLIKADPGWLLATGVPVEMTLVT